MSSLLVFLFKKPMKPSYCLKNNPDRMKYSGILKAVVWGVSVAIVALLCYVIYSVYQLLV